MSGLRVGLRLRARRVEAVPEVRRSFARYDAIDSVPYLILSRGNGNARRVRFLLSGMGSFVVMEGPK
ncbi:hypothetical protein THAOC_11865 [Thalassiosira oceanica]|uniref:Uncharacterized protein n=1 Tax=Thalassiosira oceanica TaxID=159749 RepID=K0SQ95_THAOC|nr:hypothetical protein THAOC_11865 [Thalassiosira oceanica]|eukprot:EJK67144.1 hypothetical protein THAOC_11865 [Thalassiosira oceanica]